MKGVKSDRVFALGVAGGFLALFFAFVTTLYIGALSLAIFAISTLTFWVGVAIIITAGKNLFGLLILLYLLATFCVSDFCYVSFIIIYCCKGGGKVQNVVFCF